LGDMKLKEYLEVETKEIIWKNTELTSLLSAS
jgi:hypothetical protein